MKVLAAAVVVVLFVVPAALAGPSIAGSFQGWDPADPAYDLTLNANGVYELTKTLAAETHAYKAIDGDAWGLDFPASDQSFTLASEEAVTWYVNLGATVGTKEGDEYVFHSPNPPIVCGSFMSELGGTDWDQTDTSLTVMSDPDGDGVWEWESVIPTGSYAFKIVLNNNWDQDTYPPALNYDFGSDGATPVLFLYHMADNTTEVFSSAAPMVQYARAHGVSTIEVKFSKDVEETSAETPTNYSVSGGIAVTTATRDDADNSVVFLDVSPDLTPGTDYQVVVTGVTDLDGRPIDPENNDACFYLHEIIFEINMHLYVELNGVFTTLHIQGDTWPLTWEQCGGSEAVDDGTGDDTAAGDTTYTLTEYFSMGYTCGASAESTLAKYKYVVDCTDWEGDYEFGHYVWLDPNAASQRVDVWWNDQAPSDFITCDVGVRFQVDMQSAIDRDLFNPEEGDTLGVYGSLSPLGWTWPPPAGQVMVDDGTNGDLVVGDEVYTALVTFPTGSYRFLEYKYGIHDTSGVLAFECDTYPNRTLTLDDLNGCMPGEGPMEIVDLWNWCEELPTAVDDSNSVQRSWGRIKDMFRNK